MSTTLTTEELTKIQEMQSDFTKAKLALGDLELTKQDLIAQISELRKEFFKNEKELIERYGSDAVINVKTGEVTYKKQ